MQILTAAGLVDWVRREADSARQMAEAIEQVQGWDRAGRDARLRYAADLYEAAGLRWHAEWCRAKLAD